MNRQPKAWKILGLNTSATPVEVGEAVDRLRRAWEPLLTHSDAARRALGTRKLQEITAAYQAIQSLAPSSSDWGEKMVFMGRLPDGTWGDRLKYLKQVHDGVTPTPGSRFEHPDDALGARIARAATGARMALAGTVGITGARMALAGTVGITGVRIGRGGNVGTLMLLRGLLQTFQVLSWASVFGLIALFFYADYRHQEQLHAAAEARASQQAALQAPATVPADAQEPALAALPANPSESPSVKAHSDAAETADADDVSDE